MSMKPAPPSRRTCPRYNADGSACTTTTTRADGWCGECDGFTLAQTTSREHVDLKWFQRRPNHQEWTAVPAPLAAEEAYEVTVAYAAREQFATRHTCTETEAEAQIRSLLEDLLLSGQIDRAEDGLYRLMFQKDGYLLLLSADTEVVKAYRTRHRERTWAQLKSGVKSRITPPRRAPVWARGLLDEQDGPALITWRALSNYGKAYAGGKPDPHNR